MKTVTERFLTYVSYDTQSEEDKAEIPSTEKQWALAKLLAKELEEMGALDVRLSENCYVYATIPATTDKKTVSLGFIAHMDTAPAMTGRGVKPQIVRNYQGGDICLNKEKNIWMKTQDFSYLDRYIGRDLITTDGTTLLGADDKAGVAEIMTMAEYLLCHPEIPHGPIHIGFTPDEEVSHGADLFDVERFGAEVAYTVDGGELGELEYENFNAASAKVVVHGFGIHPGSSKGKMKNALLMGMELQSLLPVFENPMYTEGYEGFYHLDSMSGNVEETHMIYIIRDHDQKKFNRKKELFNQAVDFMNQKYGEGTVEAQLEDSYYNMKEIIDGRYELIDIARKSMESLGIIPVISPIRGGTDGARLSYMGLPCPNLGTGGGNFHGKYEFVCIQSMEKIVELLVEISRRFGDR